LEQARGLLGDGPEQLLHRRRGLDLLVDLEERAERIALHVARLLRRGHGRARPGRRCRGPRRPAQEARRGAEQAAHRRAPQRRSPTRWSLRRLVVPVTHIGDPEMITSTSLTRTLASPRSVASTSSIISSVVSTLRMSRDDTPQDSARRRWTSTNGVSAMI